MELEGIVKNGVIVPQGECTLPEGTRVRIQLNNDVAPQNSVSIWQKLTELGKKAELRETNLPADLAENHDHYLHGRSKQP